MRFPWSSTPRRIHYKPLIQVPFFGQDALLRELHTRLQAAQNGMAQFVTLEGQAGSGKTAVLEEFAILHCTPPSVLLVSLNAANCLLAQEFYSQFLAALQACCLHVLRVVYNDTKRLRRSLGLTWDETEFGHVLASLDWAEQAEASSTPRGMSRQTSSLAALFHSVSQQPWAAGAAMLLEVITRGAASGVTQQTWPQRLRALYRVIQARGRTQGMAVVILIDQLTSGGTLPEAMAQEWRACWQAFATAADDAQLPLMVCWAGTAAGIQPVRQCIQEQGVPLTNCHLEPLATADYHNLLRRVQRVMPRAAQTTWQRVLTATSEVYQMPGRLLLSAAWVASGATAEDRNMEAVEALAQADEVQLVGRLVGAIEQRYPADADLFRQLLEVYAFFPAGKQFTVEELMPHCALETLNLDPAAGRSRIEILLGQCARHGLLHYDPYATRYTTGHSGIQLALQQLVSPDEVTRQEVARRRRLAVAIFFYIQQGERRVLAELAYMLQETEGGATRDRMFSLLVTPFRRWLPACSKAERQRMAAALGGFPSPLAIDLLRLMLHDEDGQVRSGVVQSLADLGGLESSPVLVEALADANSDVRWIATRALGQMDAVTAVEALIPMLQDEDKEVGRIAAQSLGQQGDARAVPHLIAAMRESYPLLRESAALALGQLADRRALPALQELLHDDNRQVRQSAEQALARLATSA